MKIAVVGSGISGLSAAYYLSKKHHVDLFEREDHFGGHSHTIDIFFDEKKVSVDIGFIVFNFQTYPNLINFFKENDIQIEKSNMSFSVSVDNTNFEYCGKGLSGIFSNKSNLFNIEFLKMFFDIIKFYKKSDQVNVSNDKITLGEYLKINKLSKTFIDYHDERPVKVEGNEKHPTSLGKSNSFAQASTLEMYDPDRARGVKFKGKKVDWNEYLNFAKSINDGNGKGLAVLMQESSSPTIKSIWIHFI